MTINCKLCTLQTTCQWAGKAPECTAFNRTTCGRCRRYTSFEDFGKGTCDIEGEGMMIYVSDPACEHFKDTR